MSRRRKNALLQRVEYLLYRAAARAVRSASDDALRRWGSRLGNLARRFLRSRDRLAMRNLTDTFPEKSEAERRRILDECWRHFGREALATIRMQHVPIEEIPSHCRFVDAHILEDAIAQGRGVVLLSAHYGAWEIAGLAIIALVKNVHTVARPLDNELPRARPCPHSSPHGRSGCRPQTGRALAAQGAVAEGRRHPPSGSGGAAARRDPRAVPGTAGMDDRRARENGVAARVRDCVRFLHSGRNRAPPRVRGTDPNRSTGRRREKRRGAHKAHQRRDFPPHRGSPGVMVVDARPLEGERVG